MDLSLLQDVPAAGKGAEDWMQVVIVVGMAIVYGVSAILKSKSNEAKEEKQQKQQRKRAAGPVRRIRPEEVRPAGVKAKRAVPESVPDVRKPESAVPKGRIESKFGKMPDFISKTIEELKEITSETVVELPEFTGRAVKQLEKKYAAVDKAPKAKAKSKKVVTPLLDFSQRGTLKRAVLHYEILGKPLALRRPGQF